MFSRFGHFRINRARFDEWRNDSDSTTVKNYAVVASGAKNFGAVAPGAKTFTALASGAKPYPEVAG